MHQSTSPQITDSGPVAGTLRAMIYSRVSSEEQALGYSLVTQAESCRSYCAERGFTVIAEFADSHSGTALDRPGLTALLEAVATLKPNVIVVLDVDRLARGLSIRAITERELTRFGAKLVYTLGGDSDTPDGRLLNNIKASLAEYENYMRNERSKRGKDGRVRAGGVMVGARPPYGYRYIAGDRTGRLEPDPQESPIVQRIYDWTVSDGLGTAATAQRLAAEGVPTRGDGDPVVVKKAGQCHWHPSTISGILRSPTYRGEWFWNKTRMAPKPGEPDEKVQVPRPESEWLSVAVPPLVDEATWERAQAQLDRNRALAKRNTRREYLLRGLICCPSCGRRWIGRYRAGRDRGLYFCTTTKSTPWRGECTARFSIEQGALESAVLGTVKAFLLDPQVRAVALAAERERVAEARDRVADDLAALDARLLKVEQRLGKLLDAMVVEDFPPDMVAARKGALIAERKKLMAERGKQTTALAEPVINVEAAIAELAPVVEAAFAAAEPSELRRLLDLLRIEVLVIDRETVRVFGVLGSVVTPLC